MCSNFKHSWSPSSYVLVFCLVVFVWATRPTCSVAVAGVKSGRLQSALCRGQISSRNTAQAFGFICRSSTDQTNESINPLSVQFPPLRPKANRLNDKYDRRENRIILLVWFMSHVTTWWHHSEPKNYWQIIDTHSKHEAEGAQVKGHAWPAFLWKHSHRCELGGGGIMLWGYWRDEQGRKIRENPGRKPAGD